LLIYNVTAADKINSLSIARVVDAIRPAQSMKRADAVDAYGDAYGPRRSAVKLGIVAGTLVIAAKWVFSSNREE